MECKKCGKPIEKGLEYCEVCESELNQDLSEGALSDEFNVLYDIDGFDVLEEDKFEAKQKQKKFIICVCIVVVVLVCAFVGINWARNVSNRYDESTVESGSASTAVSTPETSEKEEDVPVVENEPLEDLSPAEGGNDIVELREQVKKICNRYNHSDTPYEGELIGVVDNRITVSATYLVPNAISISERDHVIEAEEEIKKMFAEELKDFPEEIKVNIKMRVTYRQ